MNFVIRPDIILTGFLMKFALLEILNWLVDTINDQITECFTAGCVTYLLQELSYCLRGIRFF